MGIFGDIAAGLADIYRGAQYYGTFGQYHPSGWDEHTAGWGTRR